MKLVNKLLSLLLFACLISCATQRPSSSADIQSFNSDCSEGTSDEPLESSASNKFKTIKSFMNSYHI